MMKKRRLKDRLWSGSEGQASQGHQREGFWEAQNRVTLGAEVRTSLKW